MVQIDWLKIKMYYCSNPSASVAEVAKKYKLAEKTVRWHANREKWLEAREEYQKTLSQKLEEKMIESEAEKTAERLKKINDVADKLLDKLEKAADELGQTTIAKRIKTVKELKSGKRTTENIKLQTVDTLIDTLSARQISDSLKTLRDVYVGKEELSEEEETEGIIEIGARNEE